MEARALTQSFIDDFLGYFIDPTNRTMTSLLVLCGLPGGMMGSMMADLKGVHDGINRFLREKNMPELTHDDMVIKLFDEVQYVWPKLGYPPLVTPFSQYVKNVALLNVMQLIKGNERYSMIDNNTWDMILGKAGKLPGPLALEIIELANKQDKVFCEDLPQDNYPDKLEASKVEMVENGWEFGKDDEELFEFAMHPREYREYKSGKAKEKFIEELERAKITKTANASVTEVIVKQTDSKPKKTHPDQKEITSNAKGKALYNLYFGKGMDPLKIGDKIKIDQTLCYIEATTYVDMIKSPCDGEILEIWAEQGKVVTRGQLILTII